MKKLFKQLPLTIQQSDRNQIVKKKTNSVITVKKYNTKDGNKFSFHKPISKIILLDE